jgi:ferrous iron transport protein B
MSHPEDPGSARSGAQLSAARRIAVVGLPNTGKSQLYNELTGRYNLVANYPLTTVEPKSGPMSYRGQDYTIIDTPGLHSAYIHSEEEIVVRELLFGDPPFGLIQCVDANRLKQSLLLTLDLLALGLPLVLCLTAVDETERQGLRIDARRLARRLGVEVVEHNAALNRGVEEIKAAVARLRPAAWKPNYGEEVERALAHIQDALPPTARFPGLKALLLLEGDPQVEEELRGEGGDSFELRECLARLRRESPGGWSRLLGHKRAELVEGIVAEVTAREPGRGGRTAAAVARLCRHPVFGVPILAAIVAVLYLLVVQVAGLVESGLSVWVVEPAILAVRRAVPAGFWRDLLIGDFGLLTLGLFNALVTVLPILSVFFLMLGFLEDIGYLPNLVVLTQRLLKGIGLSGRSVLSLVLGFGCKTMATLTIRGIPSRKERLITAYLIAFAIPCSAQLAISMAILGRVGVPAFLIAFAFLALMEIAAGWALNRLLPQDAQGDFIQELPPIRVPSLWAVLRKTGYRLWWFLKEALPIFLVAAAALFLVEKSGLLGILQRGLKPVVVSWLGLPLNMVEVLILTMARHEAAAGLIYTLVNQGALDYIQSIVAVTITIMFVPCFANIVALCRQLGVRAGIFITLAINLSSFLLAGALNWLLVALRVG